MTLPVPDDAHAPAHAPDDLDALDAGEELVLADLLNRVLDKGVVIQGHVVISIADIDLVAVDLRLVLASVESLVRRAERDAP